MPARESYAYLSQAWRERLRKPLARRLGKLAYVQTWESQRDGWAHVNLVLAGGALDAVLAGGWKPAKFNRKLGRVTRVVRFHDELRELAVSAGFGERVWIEPLRGDGDGDRERLAAYFAKIAREFTRSAHKAHDQRPLEAPRGFRRLRSSVRFLPARPASSFAGRFERSPVENVAPVAAAIRAMELALTDPERHLASVGL